MPKNIFIVLDGLDGSGKSLMVKKLKVYISANFHDVNLLVTREPTSGIYGSKIRQALKKEKDPMKNARKMLDLYCKDRKDHLENLVMPFFKNKKSAYNVVICDRYYYSTYAFQSTQGIEFTEIKKLNQDFLKPNLALIFDLPAEVAYERIHLNRDHKEKFENLEFMEKLRSNFLKLKFLLRKDSIKIIDASLSREKVFEQVKAEAAKLFYSKLH